MIIDTSCYPTNLVDLAWRHDGDPFTGERLLKMMDGPFTINGKPRRIDKAFIQPPQGNTIYTWTDGNRTGREAIDDYMAYTLELTQKYPDRFFGCFVYNPRCGVENGVQAIELYAREHGFKMVQFQANMHAYRPDRAMDWLRPALKKCADLGLLVKLHTGDGPYSIPTEWFPMIREFPSVNFIMAHFGVQTGGVYCFEPFQMAMDDAERLLRIGLVPAVAHRRIRESASQAQDPVRHGHATERAGHVDATARSAVPRAAARPEPRRGHARGLPRQQPREDDRPRAEPPPRTIQEAEARLGPWPCCREQWLNIRRRDRIKCTAGESTMIIDTHLHPTNLVDEAWRHTGTPFNGERMIKLMDGPYMINGKPRRIDMGFIQPPPGNTGYRDGNRAGAKASATTWPTSSS